MEAAVPSLPDDLELVRPLGTGTMARVYLARQLDLDRPVAVKVLRPELARDETARRRFEREARLAASLDHPHVVPVHRFGRLDEGTPFLVMAYVEGRTLADRLRGAGPLDDAGTRALLTQLASALAAAHRRGIIHRDVRPANVLIDEETGRYLLADFGIAGILEGHSPDTPRLTRTGQIMVGEPRYGSPEQVRGENVTGRSDIYSLAMVAYDALGGPAPYEATTRREWITAHLAADPTPVTQLHPQLSDDLEDLLLRCLAKEPDHRPTAEDMLRILERPADLAPPRPDARTEILRRRVPQIVSATLGAGVVLLGLVMGAIDIGRLPGISFELAVNLVLWALAASGVLAWFHGEKGRQETTVLERWMLAGLTVGWLATTALILLWLA